MPLSPTKQTPGVSDPDQELHEQMRRHLRTQAFQLGLITVIVGLTLACSGGGSSPTEPDGPRVVGSGVVLTQSRAVSGFNAISLEGAARYFIEQTGSESLTITAEDNILPLLRSEVVGGVLELGAVPGSNISTSEGVIYEVTVRDLNAVSLSGASTVEITRLDTPRLDVSQSGATIMTTEGVADQQTINISGPSSYEAEELQSRVVRINASGPSRTTVRVSEILDVNISLPATVQYFGNPSVSVSGNGNVQRAGG